MGIHLSVVGIFFGADLPLTTDTSVRDVLNLAQAEAKAGKIENVSDFGYRDDGVSLIAFSATYNREVNGRVTKGKYQPGEYYLAEDSDACPIRTVWQYYVIGPDEKQRIFRPLVLLNNSEKIVPAGGKLIWRLVSILRVPNPAPGNVKPGLALTS
jgi:hypothetical protein